MITENDDLRTLAGIDTHHGRLRWLTDEIIADQRTESGLVLFDYVVHGVIQLN